METGEPQLSVHSLIVISTIIIQWEYVCQIRYYFAKPSIAAWACCTFIRLFKGCPWGQDWVIIMVSGVNFSLHVVWVISVVKNPHSNYNRRGKYTFMNNKCYNFGKSCMLRRIHRSSISHSVSRMYGNNCPDMENRKVLCQPDVFVLCFL